MIVLRGYASYILKLRHTRERVTSHSYAHKLQYTTLFSKIRQELWGQVFAHLNINFTGTSEIRAVSTTATIFLYLLRNNWKCCVREPNSCVYLINLTVHLSWAENIACVSENYYLVIADNRFSCIRASITWVLKHKLCWF